jgi:hypothetical protein
MVQAVQSTKRRRKRSKKTINQKRAIADWDAKAMNDVTVVEQPLPPPSE